MRELAVTVAAERVEEVLDVLAIVAPHGVIERHHADGVELIVRGAEADLPAPQSVEQAAGRPVQAREVPDAWVQRRVLDVEPLVDGGRVAVRPEWAPAVPGMIDIALGEGLAFGLGTHVTTEMCLDVLVREPPGESLADLGCGTGVLAIAAALLGWRTVSALDHEGQAVDEAAANAERNGAAVAARVCDLLRDPAPVAEALVANVPVHVHMAIAPRLEPPRLLIASGFVAADADAVAGAYSPLGLQVADGMQGQGWAALVLR